MIRQLWTALLVSVPVLTMLSSQFAAAQYAAEVKSYDGGLTPAPGDYTNPATTLGWPERDTGEGVFPGIVSVFNPPFLNTEFVSIGEMGHVTLRLSNYVIPQPGSTPEIGVFTNSGVVAATFPNVAAGPLTTLAEVESNTFGIDSAVVDVSADGATWVSLGSIRFEMFTNAYTDVTDPFSSVSGSALSDFQQPYIGGLSDFSNRKFSDPVETDFLDILAGSGGGTWLEISGTGLAQVGYIRFSVPVDPTPGVDANFELDAITISHAAMGTATVPEPATWTLVAMAMIASQSLRSRRRDERRAG